MKALTSGCSNFHLEVTHFRVSSISFVVWELTYSCYWWYCWLVWASVSRRQV